jgi:hypothetical protein
MGGDFNQGPDFRVKPTKKSFLLLFVIIDILLLSYHLDEAF